MADLLSAKSLVTITPAVFDYSNVGTAAGTTTVASYPAYVHTVTITQAPASGQVVLYDSAGTSATEIARFVMGTTVVSHIPRTFLLDVRTKTGLTVENGANVGAVISWGK